MNLCLRSFESNRRPVAGPRGLRVFDSSYFVVPEAEGRKAYQLLLKTQQDARRVGIAKLTMHQREYTVFLRPYDHGLALHTMYFANEIREAPGYGKTEDIKLKPQEVKLAQQLVETLSEEFRLAKYHDEFQARLKALIEAKQEGREVAEAPHPHRAPVIDMMTALKKSLETSSARKAPGGPSRAPHIVDGSRAA
jgi:DNA end-binding protein Ku